MILGAEEIGGIMRESFGTGGLGLSGPRERLGGVA